MSVASSK